MNKISSFFKSLDLPKWKIDKDSYSVMAIGLMLGRTVLAGSLAPFGPALFAGLRRQSGRLSLYAAAAALVGAATLGDWDFLAYNVLAVLIITLVTRIGQSQRAPIILDSLVAGGAVAISRAVVAAVNSPSLYSYISAVLEGLCAMVVTTLAEMAFSAERSKNSSLMEKRSEALLVLVLLSLGGLHGMEVYGLRPEAVAAMGCALIVGFAAGPGGGAIAGLAAGLVVALTGSEDPAILAVLGVSGVLAGIGGWFGKVEAVLGYISGGLLMSVYAQTSGDLTIRLAEQAVSCLSILFVTKRVEGLFAENLPMLASSRTPPRPRPVIDSSSVKTAAVAHALLEMGGMLSQVSATSLLPDEGETAALGAEPSSIRQIAERVCRECPERGACWEERFGETYEAFLDLTRTMKVSGQITSESDSPLADWCQRFLQVIAELDHQRELNRLEKRLRAIDGETKDCLAFQYRCLGQLLARSPSATEQAGREHKPRSKVTMRGGSTPAEGSSRPGDMWVKYDLSPTKTLAVLVDGMGKGEAAARQSKETLDILKSLLDCGLDYDSCISFLNSALFLSCRPDSFVAVDCLLIDQDTERAYFHKLGAPPSFIRKKDGNVFIVRGSRPPAGAFNAMPCFATSEPVAPGDEVYLVSDGIFRSSPVPARAEHLLVSRLRRLKEGSLDLSVKTLLGYGRRFGEEEPPDDVTVVAVRIERL